MSAAVDFVRVERVAGLRHCAGCGHKHGGRAFGICLVEGCDCVAVKRWRKSAQRQASRISAKRFASLTEEQRQVYERAARNFDESELRLQEFAAELDLDAGVLWRVRRSLRPATSVAAHGGGVI